MRATDVICTTTQIARKTCMNGFVNLVTGKGKGLFARVSMARVIERDRRVIF